MATNPDKLQPIIVKKVKKGGHGAHGGAWKIAYADFVTAMMAFFLLMWLLGSTSEGDKKGLADFFASPMKVALQGGSGAGQSSSVINGGGTDLTRTTGQNARADAADVVQKKMVIEAVKAEIARQDAKKMQSLSQKISAAITSNPKLAEFSSQIRLDATPDGLQIQIVDDQRRPMFDSGSAVVKPYMRDILREIGAVLAEVDNKVSLDGHTDRTPYGSGERGYSNWELSADRANASRRELLAAGLPEDHVGRVVGLAASNLLDPADPTGATNRRISIIVLTKEAEERLVGFGRTAAGPVPVAQQAKP
ncbi:MAG: flagellar motor protein MotB [Rhodoferax sp.]|nr:flagellar motor protein MotB [Rhodoferax sp.]